MQAKAEMVKFNNKMEGAVKIKPGSSKVGKLKRKLKRKKRKEVDPKAPKRPVTAYFEFLGKERRKMWSDKKSAKSASYQDVLKELGRRWKNLSEEDRAPFVAIANEKKKKFRQVS